MFKGVFKIFFKKNNKVCNICKKKKILMVCNECKKHRICRKCKLIKRRFFCKSCYHKYLRFMRFNINDNYNENDLRHKSIEDNSYAGFIYEKYH